MPAGILLVFAFPLNGDAETVCANKNKDNIINPSTFRDNYYLVIGILIVGLICFIQMKSKTKRKL